MSDKLEPIDMFPVTGKTLKTVDLNLDEPDLTAAESKAT